MYVVDSYCTSQCNKCGTLCEAFPISDLSSIALYNSKKCVIVVGDLYVTGLPTTVSNGILFSAVGTILEIRGSIFMENNLFRTSMNAFRNLQKVDGVTYLNNPSMIDARMPALVSMPNGISVTGCDRLCRARYTVVGPSPDDTGCANQNIEEYMVVTGGAQVSDLPALAGIFANIMRNLTGNAV